LGAGPPSGSKSIMRFQPNALLVLIAFWAMFLIGLDVRIGMAAIIAVTVIDWLFIAAPFIPAGGRDRRSE
jgi:hypothetical protein